MDQAACPVHRSGRRSVRTERPVRADRRGRRSATRNRRNRGGLPRSGRRDRCDRGDRPARRVDRPSRGRSGRAARRDRRRRVQRGLLGPPSPDPRAARHRGDPPASRPCPDPFRAREVVSSRRPSSLAGDAPVSPAPREDARCADLCGVGRGVFGRRGPPGPSFDGARFLAGAVAPRPPRRERRRTATPTGRPSTAGPSAPDGTPGRAVAQPTPARDRGRVRERPPGSGGRPARPASQGLWVGPR